MATLGKIFVVVGLLLLLGAISWWYAFFEQVLGQDVKRASECFYYTTDLCRTGAILEWVGDIPMYSPWLFWVSAAVLAAGVALIAFSPRSH